MNFDTEQAMEQVEDLCHGCFNVFFTKRYARKMNPETVIEQNKEYTIEVTQTLWCELYLEAYRRLRDV